MDTESRENEALGPRLAWKPAVAPSRQALAGRYGQLAPGRSRPTCP